MKSLLVRGVSEIFTVIMVLWYHRYIAYTTRSRTYVHNLRHASARGQTI